MATKLAAKPPHVAAVWFTGVCDTLLMRIQTWAAKYDHGEIYATRLFMRKSLDMIDVPVQYVHVVPFSLVEMTHLVRILSTEKPRERLTEDFTRLLAILRNPQRLKTVSKMITVRPGGFLHITLVLEKQEVLDLAELLLAVKEGRSGQLTGIDLQLAKQKKAGKGLWES